MYISQDKLVNGDTSMSWYMKMLNLFDHSRYERAESTTYKVEIDTYWDTYYTVASLREVSLEGDTESLRGSCHWSCECDLLAKRLGFTGEP